MEKVTFKFTGTSGLMMHKDTLSNPLHPLTKKHKELTGKRKKTDEDHEAIMLSEWRAGLHIDKTGPYIPGAAIQATLMNGAKEQKLGSTFKKAVRVLDDKVYLKYSGPTDIEAMSTDDRFRDVRAVVIQRSRLMRCRPIFPEWSITCDVYYLPSIIDKADLVKAAEDAGLLIGMLENRPTCGRFSVEVS